MTGADDGAGVTDELASDDAIREATMADLDDVVEAWVDLVEHGRAHGLHIEATSNRTVARQTLAAAIDDDLAFVASAGDRIVGFCSLALETGGFDRDVDRGVVENLYVEPSARGRGLGSALLAAGEQRLIDRGADAIAVETMIADEDVVEFYRERGYRPQRLSVEKRVETNR
ncbi:N-acetyltransferase [Salinarchaeum chitinilyticum]